tara:strand:- start:237 stop:650 length:414 start_codon:yes stop_codon:yes gene_type:complete
MGTYLKYEDAINLCEKIEVKNSLDKLLNKFEFITTSYVRERINEEFGYSLSNYYYSSLMKVLANENSWFYGSNYLSSKNKKKLSISDYVKNFTNNDLSRNQNYKTLSKNIGISYNFYNSIIDKMDIKFDINWIHQNE